MTYPCTQEDYNERDKEIQIRATWRYLKNIEHDLGYEEKEQESDHAPIKHEDHDPSNYALWFESRKHTQE